MHKTLISILYLFSMAILAANSQTICHGNFYNGFEDRSVGIWKNAENSVALVATDKSQEGVYALKFNTASGVPSLTSDPIDMAIYEFVRVDFYGYPQNMEQGDYISLEFASQDNPAFQLIKKWEYGVAFENDGFYWFQHIDNPVSDLSNGPIQFRITVSGAEDDVLYLDNLAVAGCNPQSCAISITEVKTIPSSLCSGDWSIEIKTTLTDLITYIP